MGRKGSDFERDVCRRLSLWWSGGKDDDLFWRTAGSGARATSRGKKGKGTTGHYGDVAATSHEGAPLLDLLTFELKRGRSKFTIQDLLDKPPRAARQEYEDWIDQAIASHKAAGSLAWAVVFRRDKRVACVMAPYALWRRLVDAGASVAEAVPLLTLSCGGGAVVLLRLDDFLAGVTPDLVRKLAAM